ncbi:MAG: trigger factor [Nitrospirae bacterium CG_4_10_14_0_8_um_filter_41_23]|nr:MAG: trigger factor [Nitrospirae bacterium CG11_big_fil_rev_8_21_14_0_20_41_14]PIV44351.1 MAG: trigger factor [Nitrospirae bacterium CG02_land_8_20_14_3_00_41_53]PIW87393.1 MAG: trigger factor [Nitrospirae bacterium CG_4_8_14_3_um_filter_41_47]PIY87793.1 MAG: trigger factor [Nitrospirae bacterium CG_4_10_14_0_8_um_filter_41_23]PJA79533.1 MAG: trigger factor [Nitrospirae bacterium CG_4_9_14_3_um_filter_41_27]
MIDNNSRRLNLLKSVEDISTTKKRLRIEIPSDVIEKEIGDSIEKVRQKAKIPGFRPGRTPVNIIEKRFGKEVEAEVLDKIIPEYYSKALKEAELTPAAMPVFDEKLDFKRNNPVSLSITVEVMPKIENLNYENIEIEDIPVIVDEAEVEEYLKKLQGEKAIYEVSEKEIDTDDLVSFEYVDAKIAGEENAASLKEQISKMGNEILPPDIIEKMIGKKKDDIVEFTTTPKVFGEDCKSKELAGKTIDMKVAIKEIKKKNLPTIDDEFAKDLGFENISEMKEKIKEKILNFKKEHAARIQKAKIVNKILEAHNFEVPEALVKRELESVMLEESMGELKGGHPESGITHLISEADSPEQEEKNLEKLQTELKNKALKTVQASIIIDVIGQKEGITVTDDEIKDRIAVLAQRLSAAPEAVIKFYKYKEGSLEGLRHSIFEDKVLDMLLSKAIIEKGE